MQCPEEKKHPALEEPDLPDERFSDGQPYEPRPLEEPVQNLETEPSEKRTSPEPVQDLHTTDTPLEDETSDPASREEVATPDPSKQDPAASASKHATIETIDLLEEPVRLLQLFFWQKWVTSTCSSSSSPCGFHQIIPLLFKFSVPISIPDEDRETFLKIPWGFPLNSFGGFVVRSQDSQDAAASASHSKDCFNIISFDQIWQHLKLVSSRVKEAKVYASILNAHLHEIVT